LKREIEQRLLQDNESFFSEALGYKSQLAGSKLSSSLEANPTFSKRAGRLILIRRPVFKIASVQDIREGGSAGLLAVGTLPNHGKNCVRLLSL